MSSAILKSLIKHTIDGLKKAVTDIKLEDIPNVMHEFYSAAIAAGAVRSAVWDSLHGFDRKTSPSDIDLIFYDSIKTSPEYEKKIEEKLFTMEPAVNWEAVNQATIHTYNEKKPNSSLEHAMTRGQRPRLPSASIWTQTEDLNTTPRTVSMI